MNSLFSTANFTPSRINLNYPFTATKYSYGVVAKSSRRDIFLHWLIVSNLGRVRRYWLCVYVIMITDRFSTEKKNKSRSQVTHYRTVCTVQCIAYCSNSSYGNVDDHHFDCFSISSRCCANNAFLLILSWYDMQKN